MSAVPPPESKTRLPSTTPEPQVLPVTNSSHPSNIGQANSVAQGACEAPHSGSTGHGDEILSSARPSIPDPHAPHGHTPTTPARPASSYAAAPWEPLLGAQTFDAFKALIQQSPEQLYAQTGHDDKTVIDVLVTHKNHEVRAFAADAALSHFIPNTLVNHYILTPLGVSVVLQYLEAKHPERAQVARTFVCDTLQEFVKAVGHIHAAPENRRAVFLTQIGAVSMPSADSHMTALYVEKQDGQLRVVVSDSAGECGIFFTMYIFGLRSHLKENTVPLPPLIYAVATAR